MQGSPFNHSTGGTAAAVPNDVEPTAVASSDDERAAEERRAETEAAIAASAWSALGLPTPEQFVQQLAAGEPVAANGHTFEYGKECGLQAMDWYGYVGYCGDELPTIQLARRLLSHVARVGTFGPLPPEAE